MSNITVVYWRDIPAQVIVGKGRRVSKVQLSERFEQAIDRAAMKSGAAETDAYLSEWRKVVIGTADGDLAETARHEAERLESEYDKNRLIQLIDQGGLAVVNQ